MKSHFVFETLKGSLTFGSACSLPGGVDTATDGAKKALKHDLPPCLRARGFCVGLCGLSTRAREHTPKLRLLFTAHKAPFFVTSQYVGIASYGVATQKPATRAGSHVLTAPKYSQRSRTLKCPTLDFSVMVPEVLTYVYMYLRVCVCIHICMYRFIHTCVCVCVCVYSPRRIRHPQKFTRLSQAASWISQNSGL